MPELGSKMAGALALAAAVSLLAVRLEDPPGAEWSPTAPTYVHDECYQAFTAHRWAMGDANAWKSGQSRDVIDAFSTTDTTKWTTYEWVHPPLAKLVMVAGIKAFGFRPLGFRFGSLLCGAAMLGLLLWLCSRELGPWAGAMAVALLGLDGMFFVMSRIAMNDIYVACFSFAAAAALYQFVKNERLGALYLCGFFLALAVSSKWNVGAFAVACAVWAGTKLVKRGPRGWAHWAMTFGVIPLAMYLLCYVPYFLNGHGLHELWSLQREIWAFHRSLKEGHDFSSPWYSWPWVARPVWFFLESQGQTERDIYAMGNPVCWWLFIPSLGWVVYRFVKLRSAFDAVILLGFATFWLPWAFIGRVAFMQYLLPAVPFGVAAIVRTFSDFSQGKWGWPARALVAAALAVFVNFYPIWSGLPVSREAIASKRWHWFPSWPGGR